MTLNEFSYAESIIFFQFLSFLIIKIPGGESIWICRFRCRVHLNMPFFRCRVHLNMPFFHLNMPLSIHPCRVHPSNTQIACPSNTEKSRVHPNTIDFAKSIHPFSDICVHPSIFWYMCASIHFWLVVSIHPSKICRVHLDHFWCHILSSIKDVIYQRCDLSKISRVHLDHFWCRSIKMMPPSCHSSIHQRFVVCQIFIIFDAKDQSCVRSSSFKD